MVVRMPIILLDSASNLHVHWRDRMPIILLDSASNLRVRWRDRNCEAGDLE